MQPEIAQLKSLRNYIVELIQPLTIEQLNTIPPKFTNNIIWNVAHLLASQQRICYMRSNLPYWVANDFIEKYKIETKPESFIAQEECTTIKNLFLASIDQLDVDYKNGLFKTYTTWTNPYGITIHRIDEALKFLPFHEGLHTGTILALKKLV